MPYKQEMFLTFLSVTPMEDVSKTLLKWVKDEGDRTGYLVSTSCDPVQMISNDQARQLIEDELPIEMAVGKDFLRKCYESVPNKDCSVCAKFGTKTQSCMSIRHWLSHEVLYLCEECSGPGLFGDDFHKLKEWTVISGSVPERSFFGLSEAEYKQRRLENLIDLFGVDQEEFERIIRQLKAL